MRDRVTGPPKDWRAKFLRSLRNVPNVAHAARYAGVSRKTAYEHKAGDTTFSEQWEAAIEESIGELEEVAFQRAKDQSDTLMALLLKSHKREVYGDKQQVDTTQRVVFVDESSQLVKAAVTPQVGGKVFADD